MIYVLLILWSNGQAITAINQEFYDRERCEVARKAMVESNSSMNAKPVSQGCYKK